MHTYIERLGLPGSAFLLMACAGGTHQSSADAAYLAGRDYQLAHSSAQAMQAYRDALLADPQHVDARNGVASLLAEQGDFAGAIALWQGLIAQRGSDAYLFRNLGHAYFLSGQYPAAQQAQERACLLDPADGQNWQRLASTLAKIGDMERALRMQRQALALLEHDLPTDASLTGSAQIALMQGVDGLQTFQRTAPVASLEIANGNGVPGMARATARRVRGLRVERVSNASGFDVQRTRIEYRPTLRRSAQRLARQVQSNAVLIETPRGLTTDLRLVLGRNARPRV